MSETAYTFLFLILGILFFWLGAAFFSIDEPDFEETDE